MKTIGSLISLTLGLLMAHALQAQTISVDQQALVFTAQVNGTSTSLPLNVNTSPSGAIVLATPVEQTSSNIPWLSVSPNGGQTPITMSVTIDPSKLSPGTYTGSIVVSVFGSSSRQTVPVTLTVSTINVVPPSLSLTTAVGNTPLVQSVTLTASQTITFSVSVATTNGGNWLNVSPPAGIVSLINPGAVSAIPDAAIVPTLSPGTYNATITITPTSGSLVTPIVVPVTLVVTPAPAVTASTTALNLLYQIGGIANVPQKVVTLTTPSSQGVPFTAAATSQPNPFGGTWVVVSPASGVITPTGTPVSVAYNPAASLTAGTWLSTLTISTPNGTPTSTTIPINLLISTKPLLNVPGDTLTFTSEFGTPNPAPQSVNVTSTNGGAQAYTVAVTTTDGTPWLVAPTTSTTPTPLSISVNPAGLVPGTYTGTVTVTGTGTGNGAQTIPVTLNVRNDPAIVANFTAVALPFQLGQSQNVSQAISLTSSNGVPLNYTATSSTNNCGTSWLPLGSSSGTTPGQFTLAINPVTLTSGTCTGTISIAATNAVTGTAAINSPLTIPVVLTVNSAPMLVVSPLTPAVFTAQTGGNLQGPLIYTFTSTSAVTLNYSISSTVNNGGGNWLQVSQTNGQTTAGLNTIGISVQPGQLAAGTYTGTVTITSAGVAGATVPNSPLTIPVKFVVTSGSLVLGQTALSFKQAANGAPPANQVVTITSNGPQITFAASAYTPGSTNWLTVTPSGTTPGSISVGVDGSTLAQGTYNGTITIQSTTPNIGNSPATIPVTLTVNAGTISADVGSLTFTQVQGGPPPASQSLNISGTPNSLPFQATANTGSGGLWLSTSRTSGNTPQSMQVIVGANTLQVGSYIGNVTVVSPGADGSPVTVQVVLNVVTPHSLTVAPSLVTFTAAPGATTKQTTQVQLTSVGGNTTYNVTTSGGAWLSASPVSGNTPDTLTVTVNPSGLTTAAYSGTVFVNSPNAVAPATITVNLVIGKPPQPALNAVANAASYTTGAVAPGENIVIFGAGIGPPLITKGTVTNGIVDTSLAATRVLFDGIPAPILYVLSTQSSVMVPYELTGRSTTNIVVEYQGVQSNPVAYTVVLASPGIYAQNAQGSGPGAILNQDYSINLPSSPAAKGSVIAVYMTGEGFTVGNVDGAIATSLQSPVLGVSAVVGGLPANVVYAGSAPGIINGATQVNVQIPLDAPSGTSVPIVIMIGSGSIASVTQAGITVSIR